MSDTENQVEEVQERVEPLQVLYCSLCTIPVEYCMYGSCKDKCKKILQKDYPEVFASLYPEEAVKSIEAPVEGMAALTVAEGEEGVGDEDKKHQSRGGKGLKRDPSSAAEKEAEKRAKAKLVIHISERNRRKAITYIKGFEAFGLELKKVAKRLANKYACGCSVVKMPAGHEEVALQGDFIDDLLEFIPGEYPVVLAKQIEVNIK